MQSSEEVAERAILRMVDRDRQVTITPLVVKIVVHPDNVDIFRPPSKLGLPAPRQEVERFELNEGIPAGRDDILRPVRAWNDIDGRLGVNDAGPRIDIPHWLNCGYGGLHQDSFQFVAGVRGERTDKAKSSTCPGPEGNLVDGNIEWDGVRLIPDHLSSGPSKASEAVDEGGRPNVEVVRPAPVGKVPDDLGAGFPSRPQHGKEARPVVVTGRGLDQVPAQAIAHRPNAVLVQHPVVGSRVHVVMGCRCEVESPSVTPAVGGAIKPPHEETVEETWRSAGERRRTQSSGTSLNRPMKRVLV